MKNRPGMMRLALLVMGCLLSACQQESATEATELVTEQKPVRASADSLDQLTANSRKARVSALEYDIDIVLVEDSNAFNGEVSIRFDLAESESGSDLTVDFGGGSIIETTLNGDSIQMAYNGFFLTLPGNSLRVGPNNLVVRYAHPYSEDGAGLHRYVDPADEQTYLYTYLWPYYANRLFPAFDQPNLKARYKLTVKAPESWIVVSMTKGIAEPSKGNGRKMWRFERTPLMATYAFSLHAGPYAVWEADADGIPMRLMARQSLAEFVAVEEWFDITRKGLKYYDEYFDIPYPYEKYDQLLVPDFNIGAMENAAAVTFNEQYYIQRQPSDRSQRENRAGTILHEMAHMWFGDLVTHNWWNGMWLNESFATQMSTMAQLATTEFDDTWHGFFTNDKQQAYQADSRVTTHPIEGPVDNTVDFFLVFDAITYNKGASVLKQLEHYVGDENYRQGVSDYLKTFANGNTELDDFIRFQSQSSGKDISAWADQWLYQPGFNTLAAHSQCESGVLQSLTISQAAPAAHPVLRNHQIDLALYAEDAHGALLPATVIPATIEGAETQVDIPSDLTCPSLINPNHNDWTLAQIELDDQSLETLDDQLGSVPEPLSRSMFLSALYHRAKSGQMPLASYLAHAMRLAESEDVIRIQQQISSSIVSTISLMQRLRPETDPDLAIWLPRLEAELFQKILSASSGDLKRIWFNTFLGVARTEEAISIVRGLLEGQTQIPGLPMTADLRWGLLTKLASSGQLDIQSLLTSELEMDGSDYGVKSNLTAQAAQPNLEQKQHWLSELKTPESLTGLSRQRAVMAGMFPANQTQLHMEMLDEILQSLPALSHVADPYFMSSYVRLLLRPICLPESAEKMQKAIDEIGGQLDSTAFRFLREAQQADAECLELRSAQLD